MSKNKADKWIKEVFKQSTYIIVDTREKANQHLIKAFNDYGVKYKVDKVNYGDYAIQIEKNEDLGIEETVRLNFTVERKQHLEELGTNLSTHKERFEREMQRCVDNDGYMIIVIEKGNYLEIILNKFKNKITPKQYLALLHTIYARYKVPFIFVDKSASSLFIYNVLKYAAKEYLKDIYENNDLDKSAILK